MKFKNTERTTNKQNRQKNNVKNTDPQLTIF